MLRIVNTTISTKRNYLSVLCILECILGLCLSGCGGVSSPKAVSATDRVVPASRHVWVIKEENHSYEDVIGNPSMPFFNNLVDRGALASQYYSHTHSSLPAWMWLVAGQPVDSKNPGGCFNVPNLARSMIRAGLVWKSYNEDLRYPGDPTFHVANYVRGHNPLTNFSDTCSAPQKYNSMPFPYFWRDVKATPANFSYINPNLLNDGHSANLRRSDEWIKVVAGRILSRPEFQAGGDGLLFFVWDEGNFTWDSRCASNITSGCGGRVVVLVIGPGVKPGYVSTGLYHQENLLRTFCAAMRLSECPGAASVAKPMSDLFANL